MELPELVGEVLAFFVWFLFGAALVPIVVDHLDVPTVVYALLSLTVLRMLPVAVALLGTGLDRRNGAVRRLVRSARPGLGRLRPPRGRGAGGEPPSSGRRSPPCA